MKELEESKKIELNVMMEKDHMEMWERVLRKRSSKSETGERDNVGWDERWKTERMKGQVKNDWRRKIQMLKMRKTWTIKLGSK